MVDKGLVTEVWVGLWEGHARVNGQKRGKMKSLARGKSGLKVSHKELEHL